ncbi:MAG: hypothetical protein KAQ75_09015, partial [Bacteroidales bacterium]|nr:hypothetical protein [Bacteroidales bacterium]
MLKFLTKRFFYALLILWGVVSLVFLLFNVLPGDPAKMMLGQRSDISTIESIRKELGLDKSKGMQYLKYLNDLSPMSFHNEINQDSYFYLDNTKYHYTKLLNISKQSVVIVKSPYLRRSYQSKKLVSDIIRETLPNTFIL